jgi:hypothetical protein
MCFSYFEVILIFAMGQQASFYLRPGDWVEASYWSLLVKRKTYSAMGG